MNCKIIRPGRLTSASKPLETVRTIGSYGFNPIPEHPERRRMPVHLLIRIPLNSCTVGKAPPVHPYRGIRIFSYSHPLGLNLKLPDSIGIRMSNGADSFEGYREGLRYGEVVMTSPTGDLL